MSKRRIAEKPKVHAGSANFYRNLAAQYREAAKDAVREREARSWSEGLAVPK